MESKQLGIKVTIGIMIHNIPEGIAIAVPCIAARPDSPWLAFWLSALSGLAEPFGAFVALFALRNFDEQQQKQHIGEVIAPTIFNMENVLAFVSGIMIMVAIAELFPEALRHDKDGKIHFVAGTICGMVLMVATELYLA
jgi:ZIP family zinc transporter